MSGWERLCSECELVIEAGDAILKCHGTCKRRFHPECAKRREEYESHENAWALPPRKKDTPGSKWICCDCEFRAHRCVQCFAYTLGAQIRASRDPRFLPRAHV